MTYPPRENIKICPECGTNLINTAKHCAVCGYQFTGTDLEPVQNVEENPLKGQGTPYQPLRPLPRPLPQHPRQNNPMQITVNWPILLVGMILLLAINTLVVLGLQKRDETKALVNAEKTTATYVATTYVSPTPAPTMTFTPAPPTETPVVDIEYTVVSGDNCLSIATRYNITLNALLLKNDIDCGVLSVGTVLKIPHPTATPGPTKTKAAVP